MNTFRFFLITSLLFPLPAFAQEAVPPEQPFIESGDRHWSLRAENANGAHADSIEADQAIAAYRQALAAAPESLAARWRLMRAFFFKGEYTTDDNVEKKRIFDEGKRLGEESLQRIREEASRRAGRPMDRSGPVELAPMFNDSPDVVGCFLWSSANWGEWALAYGKFQAVRQGAASKIRDLAAAVAMMDPDFAEGGGYRVLGRLHHLTPKIPFITGWASTKKAVEYLKKAYQIGPRNSFNRLYLAEALWDLGADSRKEAMATAEALIQDSPRPEFLIEDLRAQESARADLGRWKKP